MKYLVLLFDAILQLGIVVALTKAIELVADCYNIAIIQEIPTKELIGYVLIVHFLRIRNRSYERFRKQIHEPVTDPINEMDFLIVALYRFLHLIKIAYLTLFSVLLSLLI